MKVKELIERLSKLDPDLECVSAYDEFPGWNGPFEIRVNNTVVENTDYRVDSFYTERAYANLKDLDTKTKNKLNNFKIKVVTFVTF